MTERATNPIFSRRTALAGAAAAGAAAIAAPNVAKAQTKVTWKLQSLWPPGNQLADEVQKYADRMKVATGGRIEMQILPVGAVAGPNQTIDAVKAGVLDGHISYATLHAGIDAGFAPLGDLPGANDSPYGIMEFFYYYGGLALLREAFGRFNMVPIGVGTGSFEAIPSRKPIKSLDDLKGVKLRSPPGISTMIWERIGATPVNLPQSEVFSAIEKGVIDAADAGTLSFNDQVGIHAHAKYELLNSPHSNGTFDISVNKGRWEALPDDVKAILEMGMRDLFVSCVVRAQKDDAAVVEKAKAAGVTLSELTPADRAKYRTLALDAWQEWAKRSPLAEKVIGAYVAYLKSTGKL